MIWPGRFGVCHVSALLAVGAGLCLVAMVAAVTLGVVLRSVAGAPGLGGNDITQLIAVALAMLALRNREAGPPGEATPLGQRLRLFDRAAALISVIVTLLPIILIPGLALSIVNSMPG